MFKRTTTYRGRAAIAGTCFAAAATFAMLVAGGRASARQGETPQGPRGKRGSIARKYKNIKVIGDLPAEQLGPIMHGWSDSLGVQCVFCHVPEKTSEGKTVMNYEAETNPMKNVARDMFMLTTTLNTTQKSVGGKVTCFTCHHGQVVPESKPPAKPDKK